MNTVMRKKGHILNFVNVFMKQFIYQNRCAQKKPQLQVFLHELQYFHKIEFSLSRKRCTFVKHVARWSPIIDFE